MQRPVMDARANLQSMQGKQNVVAVDAQPVKIEQQSIEVPGVTYRLRLRSRKENGEVAKGVWQLANKAQHKGERLVTGHRVHPGISSALHLFPGTPWRSLWPICSATRDRHRSAEWRRRPRPQYAPQTNL